MSQPAETRPTESSEKAPLSPTLPLQTEQGLSVLDEVEKSVQYFFVRDSLN